ncbi:MAG TPA: dTMP kinase [Dehalococcoidia bacterium]|nr:dTMP kinase [Dehalococcoidia bacterium]
MARGKFIVIEGLDGSGITTQTEYLRTWCQKRGIDVAVTKEPTDGPAGAIIKLILRHEVVGLPGESIALLFAADRSHHVASEIEPALERGTLLVSDRYSLSSFAYQLLDVDDLDWLRAVNAKAPPPDLTIFLDVPPEACLKRMKSDAWRGLDKLQRYEELSLLTKVRSNFLSVIEILQAEGQRIVIVDGKQDIMDIGAEVLRHVGTLTEFTGDQIPGNSDASRQVAALIEKPALG